jgi:hypothetical protein
MTKKMWLIIGLSFLLVACQSLLSRLRDTPVDATLTATETARLSATDSVIVIDTKTPTISPSYTPTQTPTATLTPSPARPTATQEAVTNTPVPPTLTVSPKPGNAETLPHIIIFKADVQEADPGDTIVLSWQTSGATGVILYLLPPSHHLPQSGWDGPPSGNITITIPSESRNYSEFLLYAHNTTKQSTSKGLTVYLRCPDSWFFAPEPDICPTAPLYSFAAVQHFQHGVMLWIEDQDRIIVLYDDNYASPKYSNFQDEWDEGEPDRDPSIVPPEGLHQPIRGFGLVWRTYPEVRDRLGWAIAGEVGYNTIIQQTTRYKYNETYIRAADGNVWYLGPELSSWEKIPVQP